MTMKRVFGGLVLTAAVLISGCSMIPPAPGGSVKLDPSETSPGQEVKVITDFTAMADGGGLFSKGSGSYEISCEGGFFKTKAGSFDKKGGDSFLFSVPSTTPHGTYEIKIKVTVNGEVKEASVNLTVRKEMPWDGKDVTTIYPIDREEYGKLESWHRKSNATKMSPDWYKFTIPSGRSQVVFHWINQQDRPGYGDPLYDQDEDFMTGEGLMDLAFYLVNEKGIYTNFIENEEGYDKNPANADAGILCKRDGDVDTYYVRAATDEASEPSGDYYVCLYTVR